MLFRNNINLNEFVTEQHRTGDTATQRPNKEKSGKAEELALENFRLGLVENCEITIKSDDHKRHAADKKRCCLSKWNCRTTKRAKCLWENNIVAIYLSLVCLSGCFSIVLWLNSHPQQGVCSRKFHNIINSTGHSIKQITQRQREQTDFKQHALIPVESLRIFKSSMFESRLPRENSVKRQNISINSKHCYNPE